MVQCRNGESVPVNEVRRATRDDLTELRRIYAAARAFMKTNGNPTQWGDSSPTEESVLQSIEAGECWLRLEEGRICGTFCIQLGEEPTYAVIEDGKWQDDEPYVTIHRLASDGTAGHTLDCCLRTCEHLCIAEAVSADVTTIRIDTHRNNAPMHHLLLKNGFVRCGIIHVADGSERIAYQRRIFSK